MNKTVNINLSGLFFHIDEDAYLKLQHYLDAIKRSFTDAQGRTEIIADIEARIAELFNERIKNERQVVRIQDVEDVIAIMGQPEDYLVDDDIFEDKPQHKPHSNTHKKLFRDTDNSYVGGVSAGLEHYLGIDVIWIRLIWFILFFGYGIGPLLYIILWILIPEAKTTTDKLMMTGKPVNISNIEKKIKDGIDTVTDAAKNAANKHGGKIKSVSTSFFGGIGKIFMLFFKIIAKCIGVFFMLIGGSAIVGLIILLLSINSFKDNIHFFRPIDELVESGNISIWLISVLILFIIGIPFFFILYLGLKILINNLKSIGSIAKFTLFGIWLAAVISFIVITIQEANTKAITEYTIENTFLNTSPRDTLYVSMKENSVFRNPFYKGNETKKLKNSQGEATIYGKDINILVQTTSDSVASIKIEKNARGKDHESALNHAKNIDYQYHLKDNQLLLDTYLSTNAKNNFRKQEVAVYLLLPVNTVVKFDGNTKNFLYSYHNANNIVTNNDTDTFLTVTHNGIFNKKAEKEKEKKEVTIKKDTAIIDKNGIKTETDKVKVNIDANGVKIESKDDK
ncbi:MAG: PspC domain-containing protein [Aestuariibaculum sp.]